MGALFALVIHLICFNEAAGIHRRKLEEAKAELERELAGFNEAAGIHRRKR